MEVCTLAAALLGVLAAGAFVFLLLPLLVEFLVTPTHPAPPHPARPTPTPLTLHPATPLARTHSARPPPTPLAHTR